ncbi:MAG: hypothetical protein QM682_16930 [Paracoccus sp. (in: a-proteobacteria)]|uniref:hypothetical protein n=1 Tax=Paracoccus sp. TaxID=267 RepID=UPI0039E5C7AB
MMEPIKTIAPIFIGKTRSFWLGILPLLLTLANSVLASVSAGGDGGPVAALIARLFGWEPEIVKGWLLLIAPVWGLIIAQQRAGLTRPYTIDPTKKRQIAEVVEDGKSAFEAGKMIGAALRKAGSS